MSIIKHVTLQKIVALDFRYDPRTIRKLLRSVDKYLSTQKHTNPEHVDLLVCNYRMWSGFIWLMTESSFWFCVRGIELVRLSLDEEFHEKCATVQ